MSLHYILDGYNIIKQMPSLTKIKLRDSRGALTSFIELYHPQGSKKNKVTIVFDGSKNVASYKHNYPFDVLFTRDESADDRIRKIIQRSKNPKNVVVVTDDKELRFFVRSLSAQTLSVSDFLSKAKGDTKKTQDEKRLSFSTKEKITGELRKIWLK